MMSTNTQEQRPQRPILLVDAANLFIRNFTVNPTMSSHGVPMGGAVGFMNMLKTLIEMNIPQQVVVAWEGGGSTRRRQLYPEYKANRQPVKLNRFYEDDMPNTVENRDDQIKAVISCLKHVPIVQVYVPDCEADDVIAYLTRTRYADKQVVIASSDKDFYQLLDDTTKIYRLGKKTFVTKADMLTEFQISPANFALAKALCGDGSDNIPGVSGLGFKTIARRFPMFSSDEQHTYDAFMTECKRLMTTSKLKVYQTIADSEDLIKRNLRLVDLDGSMLAPDQRKQIDHVVDTFVPVKNKIGLMRELIGLGLNEFNVDAFFYAANSIA